MLDMHYEHWRKKLDNDSMEETPLNVLKGDIATDALFYIFQTPEYVALKTLIGCQDIPHERPLKEPEEKEGKWMEWSGGQQPVADNILVEIKFRDGSTQSYYANGYRWEWASKIKNEFNIESLDIIAYRIISEPKETKKEPKKQTLMDYIYLNAAFESFNALSNQDIFQIISKYLETNNV